MVINREGLAWVAGLMDGEAHFRLNFNHDKPTSKRKYSVPQLVISQIDRQILDKTQSILQLGKVYGPYKTKKEHHSPFYTFQVAGFEKFQAMLALVWLWLSPVKRNQAKQVLLDFYRFNQRPKLKMGPVPRKTECHPERKHAAHGLCEQCYQRKWSRNEL